MERQRHYDNSPQQTATIDPPGCGPFEGGNRLRRRAFLAAAAGFLGAPLAMAAGETAREALAEADAIVTKAVEEGVVPGAALLVSRGGRPMTSRYYGACTDGTGATREYGPGLKSIYFSFSKAVTATVAMVSVQRGQLDLDVPVARFIPQFRGGGKEAITLRHLLSHSAGIPGVPLGPLGTEAAWKSAVDAVCGAPLEWAPGSKTQYHPLSGMFVVAEAVRRQNEHTPWDEICREFLFEPLGVASMQFRDPDDETALAVTPPHLPGLPGNPFSGHPAGACYGTPEDGLRFVALHANGGLVDGKPLLEKALHREMHTVQYADAIASAVTKGETPSHEPWGLGWLLRGEATPPEAVRWFGMAEQSDRSFFGHAGIDSVMGVGNGEGVAIFFRTTTSPPDEATTIRLRNDVTNAVVAGLSG